MKCTTKAQQDGRDPTANHFGPRMDLEIPTFLCLYNIQKKNNEPSITSSEEISDCFSN
jgi:hypothetical protein